MKTNRLNQQERVKGEERRRKGKMELVKVGGQNFMSFIPAFLCIEIGLIVPRIKSLTEFLAKKKRCRYFLVLLKK